jgi:hypothetical protein
LTFAKQAESRSVIGVLYVVFGNGRESNFSEGLGIAGMANPKHHCVSRCEDGTDFGGMNWVSS